MFRGPMSFSERAQVGLVADVSLLMLTVPHAH